MKFWFRGSLLLFFLTNVLQLTVSAQGALPHATAKEAQLNVVFHGLFSYIIWPDHVEVLAPQVDEHVYKAGSWGKEFRLREGVVYRLEGVHAEARIPDIDVRNNLVLTKISNIDHSSAKLYCSLILPMPQQMIGLRRAYPPPKQPAFQGKALSGTNPDSIPLVQTLVYKVEGQPNLGKEFPWVSEDKGSGTINLHIWAEPEIDTTGMSPSHASQAFSHLMSLFPDLDLQLAFGASASPDKSTLVRGLKPWEERSLVERSQLLFPPKRRNLKIDRGTEVSNCVGMIVINTKP